MTPELIALLQQNRMQEARALCEQLCKAQPRNAQARFMLGAIYGQLGDFAGSEEHLLAAIRLAPSVPEAHFNLGIARLRLGKADEAIRNFRRALELRASFPEAHTELGNALLQTGKPESAAAQYRQALAMRPQYAEALCNLGNALLELNQTNEATASLKAALELNPRLFNAHLTLGELLAPRDRQASLDHCHAALAAPPPPDIELLSRLALLCKRLGLSDACVDCNRKAVEQRPEDARLLTNLGVALKEAGQTEEAISRHRQALAIEPGLAEIHYNLGSALSAAGREHEAESAYRKAIELRPGFTEALTNLGTLVLAQGRTDEAIAHFDAALRQTPDHPLAADNRLFALNYTTALSPEEVCEAHRAWGEAFMQRLHTPRAPDMRSPASSGPLRVGFVSPDFRSHSVAFFFDALLDRADHSVEVHCYSNTRAPDAITGRIRSLADGWRDITALGDTEAAELIRQDGIDVLVDLAGHTGDHRLGVFALRPCPVQATYLGYPNTTGLPAIDYRITDALADPPGHEAYCTERLARLDRCFVCYTPPDNAPAATLPGTDPARPITFGSFNNLAKVSADMIRVWSAILQRVPGSRLMLKNRPLGDPEVAARFRDLFAAQGIAPERLDLISWMPGVDMHLEAYQRIDIALDTYPYHGTTTTCEALWMGRPVVVMSGATHASRVGVSLLRSVGLDALVADSESAYIGIAAALANDLDAFRAHYGDLRERMRGSPLCDRTDFSRRFFALLGTLAGRHST